MRYFISGSTFQLVDGEHIFYFCPSSSVCLQIHMFIFVRILSVSLLSEESELSKWYTTSEGVYLGQRGSQPPETQTPD